MTSAVFPFMTSSERRALEAGLGVGVDARRRLVEHEERRVAVEGAGESEELPLAHAEVHPPLVDARVEATASLRAPRPSPLEELERADTPERHLRAGAIGHLVGDGDVREDRAGKEEDVLRDDGELAPERVRVVASHVAPEDAHAAALRLVEPEQETCHRRLARPGRADEGDPLAAPRHQAHVAQDGDARLVLEVDVVERHRLVGAAGGRALLFGQRGGHHVRLVEQLEDALGPRHRALEERIALREQAHRLEELAEVLRERRRAARR